MELDSTPLSSARKTEKQGQPIDTSPPWWDGTVAIALSPKEWEYVVNGLSNLINNGYIWDSSDIGFDMSIRNIIDRIEKGMGWE
jgi:hypothetical protein